MSERTNMKTKSGTKTTAETTAMKKTMARTLTLSTFFFLLTMLTIVPGVFAAFTVTVSMPTKSLAENQQVSVTVTVQNPGTSTESNVVVQLAGSPTQWFGTPLVQDCTVI